MSFLFVHVPKRSNYYKPLDDFMFINYIPMGVFAMASRLKETGYSAGILHLGIETIANPDFSITSWLSDKDFKIIGLSLHWHFQAFDVLDVAEKLKARYPDKFIVLGGYSASYFAEEILTNFPCIDGIIRGDAEIPVCELADSIIKGKPKLSQVQNLAWRNNGVVTLNPLTYVGTEEILSGLRFSELNLLYNHASYINHFSLPLFWLNNASFEENKRSHSPDSPIFPLFIGRGCSTNCSFCGGSKSALQKIGNRKEVVYRSIPSVLKTIKEALSFGYKTMNVCFHPYPNEDQYFLDLFREIRANNIRTEFNFECWGLPTKAFIKEFALTFPGGISSIALSPETGSDDLRKKNKGIFYTNAEMYQTMQLLKEYKVKTDIFFTIGIIDETTQDITQTRKVIHTLNSKYSSAIRKIIMVPVQLEPGSPIYEQPGKYGFRNERKNFMDFYRSHSSPDSGPYSYLGFTSKKYFGDDMETAVFSKKLQDIRCQYFCLITPKIFQRLNMPFVGKLICKLSCRRWKMSPV